MRNCTLLLLSFALLASCDKATDTYVADVKSDNFAAGTTTTIPLADKRLKERFLAIEDSVGFYVGELESIEERYYAENVSNDELVQLSVAGLELQEKLTIYLKNTIAGNINNPLGIYLLAVYGELFSSGELHSLIKRIPSYPAYTSNNPFYGIVMRMAEERIQK